MKSNLRIPSIRVNAEFQRLLWLNLSWGMLLCIGLAYGMFLLIKSPDTAWSNLFLMLGFNGTWIAACAMMILLHRSLQQDMASNMFDQLRMSSLSPWQMAYSRLLAAPLLAWGIFAGAWCALGAFWFTSHKPTPDEISLLMLCLPLTMWSFACLWLTNCLQLGRGQQQWVGSSIQIALLIGYGMIWVNYFGASVARVDALMQWEMGLAGSRHISSPEILWATACYTLIASVMVQAAMAYRLHLRRVNQTVLLCALLLPVAVLGRMLSLPWFANLLMLSFIYGKAALLSVICQDSRVSVLGAGWHALTQGQLRQAFNILPAWTLLLPLAIILAACVSINVALTLFINIIIVLVAVLYCSSLHLRYNSITIALMTCIIVHFFYMLAK